MAGNRDAVNVQGGALKEKSEDLPRSFLCMFEGEKCGIMKMLNKFFCSIILADSFSYFFLF